jgi:hypothetical protein
MVHAFVHDPYDPSVVLDHHIDISILGSNDGVDYNMHHDHGHHTSASFAAIFNGKMSVVIYLMVFFVVGVCRA